VSDTPLLALSGGVGSCGRPTPPLVSCGGGRAGALTDEVYSRAIWLEGYGLGKSAVVLQPGWVQEGVGVREGARDLAEAARGAAVYVVAAIGNPKELAAAISATEVIDQYRVAQRHDTAVVVKPCSRSGASFA
jgi:hypothetical protein